MSLPSWPVEYQLLRDGFQPIESMLEPIRTEMEGGNMRIRRRPGDDVGKLKFVARIAIADLAAVKDFSKTNGAGRFNMSVWTGDDFETKVCQMMAEPTFGYQTQDTADIGLSLRVYGI